MTIYFCGGEMEDFPTRHASAAYHSDGNFWRSSYARTCINTGNGGYVIGNLAENISGEFWLHCQVAYSNCATSYVAFAVRDSATGYCLGAGTGTVTATNWACMKWTGSYTKLGAEGYSGAYDMTNSDYCRALDVHMKMGSEGFVKIYYAGILQTSYTGEVTVGSLTSFNQVYCATPTNYSSPYARYSEVILSDTDTRLMALKTLAPNAAGSASGEWVGAYTTIDEFNASDADMIYTESSGENNIWQCNLTGMPSGYWICHGVKAVYRAADGIGGFGVYGGIRTNSTDYSGELQTPGGAWANYEDYWLQNPYTGNRFTSGEIEALQLSFKAVGV